MKLRLCMLLMWAFSLTINQECFSGNIPPSGEADTNPWVTYSPSKKQVPNSSRVGRSGTERNQALVPYSPSTHQPPKPVTMLDDRPKAKPKPTIEYNYPSNCLSEPQSVQPKVSPKGKLPVSNQNLVRKSPLPSTLSHLPLDKEKQVISPQSDNAEKEGKVLSMQPHTEKEEDKESEANEPHYAKAPSDNLDEHLALGFPISHTIQVISSVFEYNLYTILFYPSLSMASHPLAIEIGKLKAIEKKKINHYMKSVETCLLHWAKASNKLEKAEEIYKSLLCSAQNAESVKIGVKLNRYRCTLLMQNTDGKILFLGVPDLYAK